MARRGGTNLAEVRGFSFTSIRRVHWDANYGSPRNGNKASLAKPHPRRRRRRRVGPLPEEVLVPVGTMHTW